jgi:hypothetical protein
VFAHIYPINPSAVCRPPQTRNNIPLNPNADSGRVSFQFCLWCKTKVSCHAWHASKFFDGFCLIVIVTNIHEALNILKDYYTVKVANFVRKFFLLLLNSRQHRPVLGESSAVATK